MKTVALVRCIFIHHSTGGDLVQYGNVRNRFRQIDTTIQFWDHGYGFDKSGFLRIKSISRPYSYGLRDGDGEPQETFDIPDDNTDPDGLAMLFSQPLANPPNNAISRILQFDCIVFKSCYPVTAIASEEKLDSYKNHYIRIRDTIDLHPTKLFVPMTPPPLRANRTTPLQANYARQFSRWLLSDEYRGNRLNLVPYDFFDELATPATDKQPNVLRPEFCSPIWFDSHPNKYAHTTVAPKWVDFLIKSIRDFFRS